ncbi:hypothetical protein [Paracoccus luteus]|uniref:hypothetical protein n=1 Tax=Paracoccus luteus TaxID=2508543 RepID=UPI001FEBD381|nr:hypothetical protein [Paracoccus luteus]
MTTLHSILARLAVGALSLSALPSAAPAQTAPFQMPKADDPPAATAPLTDPDTDPDAESGIPRGLEGILQDLLGRAQPHLEGLANELQGAVSDYGPAFQQLTGLMDDIANYQPPQRLPNGDILIRRKADAPPPPPLDELNALVPDRNPAPAPTLPPLSGGQQTEL